MASATSRATRSSWPLAPTGSRTKGQKRPGRTLLRNPPNERLSKQPRTPAKGTHRSNTSMEPKAGGQEKDKTGPRLSPGNSSKHSPERKCILSAEHGARDTLIRLALGPDGEIAPDVRAKAPGRGAWIGVDRPALEAAQTKGKLKGALARAFKTGEISIPADLGDRSERALRQSALARLGLEARAGALITGSEKIETITEIHTHARQSPKRNSVADY